MVEARDRLLAGIAPLRERDVRLVQSCLGGKNGLVELPAPGRRSGLDPKLLESLRAWRRRGCDAARSPRLDRFDTEVGVSNAPRSELAVEMHIAVPRQHLD